jgi:hypothetical protein
LRERLSLRLEVIHDRFAAKDLTERPGEGAIKPVATTIRGALLLKF